jgi:hypothetical protein
MVWGSQVSGQAFMGRKMLKIKDEWQGKQKHPRNPNIVRDAARHNLREIQAELGAESSIDSRRSRRNEILEGPATAAEVVAGANQRMRGAGIDPLKFRVDGVRLVEVMCSLPPDFNGDGRAYMIDCVAWAGQRYGGADNVVSAVIHYDEAQLHCHILLVPLLDGRMAGSDMASYKPKIIEADQIDFHERVASKHGLRRSTRHLGQYAKAALADAVVRRLRAENDSALTSRVWPAYRAAIEADPQQFADALGVEVELAAKGPMRTMAQIFTSTGKGPKKELNPIGFEHPRKTEPYPVYGSRNELLLPLASLPSTSPATALPTSQNSDGVALHKATATHPTEHLAEKGQPARPEAGDDANGKAQVATMVESAPAPAAGLADALGQPLALQAIRERHRIGRSTLFAAEDRVGVRTVLNANSTRLMSVPIAQDRVHDVDVEAFNASREREDELPTGQWDDVHGEFLPSCRSR